VFYINYKPLELIHLIYLILIKLILMKIHMH